MARVTIDGRTYEASDEALAQMAKDGVKYEKVDSGGFWQGAKDMLQRGDKNITDNLTTIGDGLRGAAHGATFGAADAKFGDDNESLMQRLGLADYDVVKERSPIVSGIGDVAGSVLSPLSKIGMAAKGAGAAARIGRAALGAGVEAGSREAFESRDADAASDAATTGAAMGGGVSAAASGLGALANTNTAGRLASAVSKGLSEMADTARVKGSGFVTKDLKALAQKTGQSGEELASETADRIERLAPSPKFGESAGDKAAKFEAIRKQQGQQIGEALDDAGTREGLNAFIPDSQGQQGYWTNVQKRFANEADALPGTSGEEFALRNAANSMSERLGAEAAPKTMSKFHERVHNFGDEAYGANKANKAVRTPENTTNARTAEMARDISRDELGQLIDTYALPETAAKFRDSMKGFSDVVDLERVAKERATSEAAASNLMGGAAIPVGAVLGFMTGGLPGAGAGAGMAAYSGTRNAIRQMAETSQGYDASANALRALAKRSGYSKTGPNAAPMKFGALGDALARQGNRRGLLAVEGMVPPMYFRPEDER